MFLIAMISLTMSRISSRADSASSRASCDEIDRLDQRAEDRALDLVIGVRPPRLHDRWRAARGAERAGRRERSAARRSARRARMGLRGCALGAASAAAGARRRRRRGRRNHRCHARLNRIAAPAEHANGLPRCALSLTAHEFAEERRQQAAPRALDLGAAGHELRELPERLRRRGGRRRPRRSSGRCWRRCRTAAARRR